HQRLQPGTGAVPLARDAERGFAETPERVAREADAEQQQQKQAKRLLGEQLQRTLLVGLVPRGLAEGDEDRDPADEDVENAARGEARASEGPGCRAVGSAPSRRGCSGGSCRSHTR